MKSLIINNNADLFILSSYKKNKTKIEHTPFGDASPIYSHSILKPRQPSEIGTESYRTACSRAFNHAKQQIYFNPDLTKLVTLTYAKNQTDYNQVLEDVKYLIKKEKRNNNKIKYIYVLEEQKRGSLHVHMITTNNITTHKNKNGYDSVTFWSHGFSSILDIKHTDKNFKPYLYLFKYMRKSQRIGGKFVHSSRGLNNFEKLTDFEFDEKVHQHFHTEITHNKYIDKIFKKSYYKKAPPHGF